MKYRALERSGGWPSIAGVVCAYIVMTLLLPPTQVYSTESRLESLGLSAHEVRSIAQIGPTLYVATDRGVLRRELGEERDWTVLGLEDEELISIYIHPSEPAIIYVGGRVEFFAPEPQEPIFKSVDGGATWFSSGEGLEGLDVKSLAGRSDDPSVIFAAAAGQIYRSEDGAVTWAELLGLSAPAAILAIVQAPSNPDVFYAGGSGFFEELYLSVTTDGGDTWRSPIDTRSSFGGVLSIAVDPNDSMTVFWGIGAASGVVWKTNFDNIIDDREATRPGFIPLALGIDPTDSSRIYAAGSDIAESHDGGTTWSIIPLPGVAQSMILDERQPTLAFIGTSNGIFALRTAAYFLGVDEDLWLDYE